MASIPFLAVALFAAACTSDEPSDADLGASSDLTSGEPQFTESDDETTTTTLPATTTTTEPPLPVASITTSISPNRLNVFDAEVGTDIVVVDSRGDEIGRDTVEASELSESGTALLRDLPAGAATVQVWDADGPIARGPSLVIPDASATAPDDESIYDQEVTSGYGYITTRDGTTLSVFVSLPGSIRNGPYPTLFEYSGYSPSDPNADDPSRLLITALGYALVQVNVRGTGCSGGSFDAFEPIQSLDGYDVIETLATQDWVDGIGMWGVSYPGIMQLHVAGTQPPSLDAIAPLSVIDRVDSVLYPGGIFNDGFGADWTRLVSNNAGAGGQAWSADRIASGDDVCEANQDLRVHNPDLISTIQTQPFLDDFAASRSPDNTAGNIDVPIFLAGAFHDEQTGGRFPAILDDFDNAPVLRAYLYNGLHIDPLGPDVLVPIVEFYDLYVADRSPGIDPITRILAATGLSAVFGSPVSLPPDNYPGLSASAAREQYESEPQIRVLFEVGANSPNLPQARFDVELDAWPSPELEVLRFHLVGGERLSPDPVSSTGTPSFVTDPDEGDVVTTDDLGRIWTNDPGWNWLPTASENRITFTSGVMSDEFVLAGPASVDLWVTIDGTDADLEATLSEIHPDGSETYIQAGWLRLSRRALAEDATELRPVISGLESDVARLSPDEEPVLVRIEILPFAHVLRDDSRLQLTIDTPGASRPQWRFDVLPEETTVTIHTGGDFDSSIALPLLADVDAPDARPPCGSLRGQPCRNG